MMLFMMVTMVTTVLNHDKVWLGLFSGDITKPRTHFRLTGDKHFDDSDDGGEFVMMMMVVMTMMAHIVMMMVTMTTMMMAMATLC